MELATNYAKLAERMAQTKETVDQKITAAQDRQQTGYNRHHDTQNHGFKEKQCTDMLINTGAGEGKSLQLVSRLCKTAHI